MKDTIQIRQHHQVAVIDITGRLMLGPSLEALRTAIDQLLSAGQAQLILNLEAVAYLDSSALGELIAASQKAAQQGGQLKLVHVRSRVFDLLIVTKLHMVFEIFDDEVAAVRSFHTEWPPAPFALDPPRPEVFVG